MSPKRRDRANSTPLRKVAQARVAHKLPMDLDALTPHQIRQLVHELEIHKVELEIQNEQLIESRLAAEASSERYRDLYESAPIGFVTLDPEWTIVESNLPFAVQLGIPRSRLIGRKLSSFVAPSSQDRWHLERRALAVAPGLRAFQIEFTRRDGSAMHAQLVGARGAGAHALADPLRFAVLDVTELRSAERALRAATLHVSLVEQRERRKLASDLHDGPGQLLALALFKLRLLGAESPTRSAAMREIEELIIQSSKGVSALSLELSPPLLHDLGLLAAAEWLAESLKSRYGLTVEFGERDELHLGEAESLSLYRAMRELLINVAKHAGVKTARVSIRRDEGLARVIVEDCGVGFRFDSQGRGFGLLALRGRLNELGGSLEFSLAPGIGTRAIASMPLSTAIPRNSGEPARPEPPSAPPRPPSHPDRRTPH